MHSYWAASCVGGAFVHLVCSVPEARGDLCAGCMYAPGLAESGADVGDIAAVIAAHRGCKGLIPRPHRSTHICRCTVHIIDRRPARPRTHGDVCCCCAIVLLYADVFPVVPILLAVRCGVLLRRGDAAFWVRRTTLSLSLSLSQWSNLTYLGRCRTRTCEVDSRSRAEAAEQVAN